MAANDNDAMSTTTAAPSTLQGALLLSARKVEGHPAAPPYPGADWGVISAAGADCASFLHGQLTQDIQHLAEGEARLAGYCSAKGRLLASFVAWRDGEERIMLACSADLLAQTLKRLQMFVLRAKCKLADASGEVALFGLAGDAARAWLGAAAAAAPWSCSAHGAAKVIRLPDSASAPRWLLAQDVTAAPPPLPALAARDWNWLEVQSGVPRIVSATSEQFVPQMVNFELVGGVDFHKGCYPGQEVVARSQYRGTLKRRMQLLHCSDAVAPGAEVFHSADPAQPAGMVVLAAPDAAGRWSALAELKLAALEQKGTLASGAVNLTPAALPYAVPSEAA
jgi:folate-binding protein YgfZ